MNKKSFIQAAAILSAIISGVIFLTARTAGDLPVIKAAGVEAGSYAVYTAEGDIFYLESIDKIRKSLRGSFIVDTKDITIDNAIGLIENPPAESITDIYDWVLDVINKDNNVLIIYIDGLGYELYNQASKAGNIPHISSLGSEAEALTVYPSITDVTFASMVTGKTPRYTGIHNREKKPLPVPTIFDIAAGKGKSSKLIEGNMKIIIDEVQTVLNTDDNENGTIDDEIYNCAMEEIENPPDILLVHFHSYDDFGHKYGPGSKEAMEQLGVLDSYIEYMMKEYDGEVIITADHGMHRTENGGVHGTFSSSDMFIPIIKND